VRPHRAHPDGASLELASVDPLAGDLAGHRDERHDRICLIGQGYVDVGSGGLSLAGLGAATAGARLGGGIRSGAPLDRDRRVAALHPHRPRGVMCERDDLVARRTGDHAGTRRLAGGVAQAQRLSEHHPVDDDAEHDQHQERHDQRELDGRCAVVVPLSRSRSQQSSHPVVPRPWLWSPKREGLTVWMDPSEYGMTAGPRLAP